MIASVLALLDRLASGRVPARRGCLDIVEGRSKQVFKQWLAQRPASWRDGVQIVAMDGFSGLEDPPPARS